MAPNEWQADAKEGLGVTPWRKLAMLMGLGHNISVQENESARPPTALIGTTAL